jgi:hypothetical protein
MRRVASRMLTPMAVADRAPTRRLNTRTIPMTRSRAAFVGSLSSALGHVNEQMLAGYTPLDLKGTMREEDSSVVFVALRSE